MCTYSLAIYWHKNKTQGVDKNESITKAHRFSLFMTFMFGCIHCIDSQVWILTLLEGVKNIRALSSAVKHSFTHWTNQSLPLTIMVTTVAENRYRVLRFYRAMYQGGWRAKMVAGVNQVCMCMCDVASLFKAELTRRTHIFWINAFWRPFYPRPICLDL